MMKTTHPPHTLRFQPVRGEVETYVFIFPLQVVGFEWEWSTDSINSATTYLIYKEFISCAYFLSNGNENTIYLMGL